MRVKIVVELDVSVVIRRAVPDIGDKSPLEPDAICGRCGHHVFIPSGWFPCVVYMIACNWNPLAG